MESNTGCGPFGTSGAKEKRYPAQIANPVTRAASAIPRNLASLPSGPGGGPESLRYAITSIGTPAARKAIAVNFESSASPMLAPSNTARAMVGRLNHRQQQNSAAGSAASSAMSVIASPAWASTGGRELNSRTAIRPAGGLKAHEVQAQTTQHAAKKNGSTPSLARNRLSAYLSFQLNRALPSAY